MKSCLVWEKKSFFFQFALYCRASLYWKREYNEMTVQLNIFAEFYLFQASSWPIHSKPRHWALRLNTNTVKLIAIRRSMHFENHCCSIGKIILQWGTKYVEFSIGEKKLIKFSLHPSSCWQIFLVQFINPKRNSKCFAL